METSQSSKKIETLEINSDDDRWMLKDIDGYIFFQPKSPEVMVEFLENIEKAIQSLVARPQSIPPN